MPIVDKMGGKFHAITFNGETTDAVIDEKGTMSRMPKINETEYEKIKRRFDVPDFIKKNMNSNGTIHFNFSSDGSLNITTTEKE